MGWLRAELFLRRRLGDEGTPIGLEAPEFGGGELDWYSFDRARDGLRGASANSTTVDEVTFLPTRLSFTGMPNPRWWNFEDGLTDFGDLGVDKVDLAKLLVMEFALLGADDWSQVPLPLDVGSLNSVTGLVVTDTFGERTIVRPTGGQAPDIQQPWRMFSLTGDPVGLDSLLLAPVLGTVFDGADLEDVLFVRDDMAAMGWGIEGGSSKGHSMKGSPVTRRGCNGSPPIRQCHPCGERAEPRSRTGSRLTSPTTGSHSCRCVARIASCLRRGVMGGPTSRPALSRVLAPGTGRAILRRRRVGAEGWRKCEPTVPLHAVN